MSSAMHTALPLFLLLVVLVNAETAHGHAGKCEKIKIPFCHQLGYNHTIFPNNLEHETQEEARIDASEFTSLVDSRCSRDIVYFLCSLYAPVCTMMQTAIPPCRSLCESARTGCEELMNNYGFRWPERFACESFPKFGENLCVGRNSSSTSTAGKSGSLRKNLKRPGKKISAAKKLRQKHCSSTTSGQGRLCCKLGRRASKKGFYCNLKKKEEPQTRKSIKFRKTVLRKCSKFSSCFRSCCEIREKRKRLEANRKN